MCRSEKYIVEKNKDILFSNNVDFCIGTGRMGLALQKEYQEQLRFVQEEIGFKYIRGHGLFSDDMAIYQEYVNSKGETLEEYNFTYLDMVMDNYLELGIRPFLELGFMPEKMASGEQTIFYWKGNVTPPKNYQAWTDMVQATLRHLMDRYGADDVVTWPIEVWNEPNLEGFWENADMEEYFRLFHTTFEAIKAVDPRFIVGGPAICGVNDVEWMRAFMEFCSRKNIELDFATRHHYCINPPEQTGHYGYCTLHDPDEGLEGLHISREIVDSFNEFKGIDFHITEFNTSYSPITPLHDTNLNAVYIAYLLSRLGDEYQSYSYWTFGDIFEEMGVPFTPFHGGFGLVANGKIPKPTFWTFQFYKQLKGKCVHKSEDSVIVTREDGTYCGVAWNLEMKSHTKELGLTFEIPVEQDGEYCLLTKLVDEIHCNPLKLWHDMGEPASLSKEQKKLLQDSAGPFIESQRISAVDGNVNISLYLKQNALVYFELKEVKSNSDRGYSYKRAVEG